MDRGRWVDEYRRCKRRDVAGHAHYLTFSCWRGLSLLNADRTRKWLTDSIEAARQVLAFDLWAWVFMPEHVRYIHANPVRRALVESPADWPWSSCRAWEEGVDDPLRIDRASLPPIER